MNRTIECALRWLAGDETQPWPRVMHGMGHLVETGHVVKRFIPSIGQVAFIPAAEIVEVMREMGR